MNLIYYTGIVFILIHELDAVRCKEWKIFPGLSLLKNKVGEVIFVIAHIPLLYWIFKQIISGNENFRMGFDYFLIVHFVLHILFLVHPKNEFKDWKSWIVIAGAALFGLLDLITTFLPL